MKTWGHTFKNNLSQNKTIYKCIIKPSFFFTFAHLLLLLMCLITAINKDPDKNPLLLGTRTPKCHTGGCKGRRKTERNKPSELHSSKSAPFAVQISAKMWEAHLELNLPYLVPGIRFCCATLCYITSRLIQNNTMWVWVAPLLPLLCLITKTNQTQERKKTQHTHTRKA